MAWFEENVILRLLSCPLFLTSACSLSLSHFQVTKLTRGETLMVNIGSTSSGATVKSVRGDVATLELVQPVCTDLGEKISLSRKVDKHWRLIGWGTIEAGKEVEVDAAVGLPAA
jgi:translation initiation factor 2 gamma subunit (eIF-2gamma)